MTDLPRITKLLSAGQHELNFCVMGNRIKVRKSTLIDTSSILSKGNYDCDSVWISDLDN